MLNDRTGSPIRFFFVGLRIVQLVPFSYLKKITLIYQNTFLRLLDRGWIN